MFGIPRNSIFFHEINFLFRHIDRTRGGHFEKLSSRYKHLAGGDYKRNMTAFSANESARMSIISCIIILSCYIRCAPETQVFARCAWLCFEPLAPLFLSSQFKPSVKRATKHVGQRYDDTSVRGKCLLIFPCAASCTCARSNCL